jgi:4-amino-4-deoxy-L-arabinose transferase-like glycosyltransferase
MLQALSRAWDHLPTRAAIAIGLITGFRFLFCTYHELVPDEAYYWLWSKHLDASYYSKGPAIAWTIAAGTWLWGDTVFGIRFFSVLLSAGTAWLMFDLARRLFDEGVAWRLLIVAATVPIFAVGSILMTIDPLSVFFWVCAAHGVWRGTQGEGLRHWLWAGFAIGSGFLAKQINALQLLCVVGWLLSDRERRRHLTQPPFWLMLAVALLCMVPVFAWNAQHGWITAQHLHERASLSQGWQIHPREFIQFLTQQALVISPGYFILMIAAWIGYAWGRCGNADPALAFCAWMAWPTFFLYAILAWNDNGEANWTVTMLPTGLLLAVAWWNAQQRLQAFKLGIYAAIALASLMTIILHETAPLKLSPKNDPLARARGWKSLAEQVHQLRQLYPQATLIANKYQTVSVLSFYLPDRPKIYQPSSPRILNQLSFWGDYNPETISYALFVTDDRDSLPDILLAQFKRHEEIAILTPEAPWQALRQWRVVLFTSR